MDTALPNFITIGGMNCGTTSLHEYLKLHPDIYMSTPKEPSFFLEGKGHTWKRGLNWYKGLFDGSFRVRGESTANYTKFPAYKGAPERIRRIVPDVKLVYLVRNPIDRIVSHYRWQVYHMGETRSFNEVMKAPRWYVMVSSYYQQLEQYLKHFPESRILILRFKNLVRQRTDTIQRVFRFVGVNDTFYHEDFELAHNQSKDRMVLNPLGRAVAQNAAYQRLLRDEVLQHPQQYLYQPVKKPTVTPEIREKLLEKLMPDIMKLESFTGWNLGDWYE